VDFFSSIPINHILWVVGAGLNLGATTRLAKLMRLFKFFRMLKVFKVLKVASSLNEWEDDPTVVIMKDMRRFLGLITGVFFMAHYAASAFSLAAMGDEKGWKARTWVADYFNDGHALKYDEGHTHGRFNREHVRGFPTPMNVYCVAIHWAFTTLTTVGYGDVLPVSRAEMAVSIVVQFLGTCILGYVMGDIASMLTKEDAAAKMIKDRIESINAYMKHRGLPQELKAQIRSHFSRRAARNFELLGARRGVTPGTRGRRRPCGTSGRSYWNYRCSCGTKSSSSATSAWCTPSPL